MTDVAGRAFTPILRVSAIVMVPGELFRKFQIGFWADLVNEMFETFEVNYEIDLRTRIF